MREIDTSYDVLVAGAGVSGVSAAVSAARGHARTILIEKERDIGGVAYSGLLQNICGLYLNGEGFPAETLNTGMAREVVSRLSKLCPRKKIEKIGGVYVLPYDREALKSVFSSLCSEVPGLTLLSDTEVLSVENRGGTLTGVRVNHQGQERTIRPGVLIDCSGSGLVSEMAGAQYELSAPDTIQLAGYILQIKGLKGVDESLSIKVPYYLKKAAEKKILPDYMKFTTFSPGDAPDEGFCKMNIPSESGGERTEKAGADASALHHYLAGNLPAFRDSRIAETSRTVMDREGIRVRGEYTLTEEDVLDARKFEDGSVKNAWPIELWDRNRGTVYRYLKSGEYYNIPFGCLKVKGISNLLTAGRCISVTHEALGSTRVMGTCISLGEQAGLAAAEYVRNGRYPYQ